MISFARVSWIVAAASIAVTSTAVMAQPSRSDEILISVPTKANLEDNQRSVQFRDLALNKLSGQATLKHRIGFAIESLCQDTIASSNPVGAMKCSNVAWDSVRPQLDQLFRR